MASVPGTSEHDALVSGFRNRCCELVALLFSE